MNAFPLDVDALMGKADTKASGIATQTEPWKSERSFEKPEVTFKQYPKELCVYVNDNAEKDATGAGDGKTKNQTINPDKNTEPGGASKAMLAAASGQPVSRPQTQLSPTAAPYYPMYGIGEYSFLLRKNVLLNCE